MSDPELDESGEGDEDGDEDTNRGLWGIGGVDEEAESGEEGGENEGFGDEAIL